MTFYEKFIQLCNERGVTGHHVAQECRISHATIINWEKAGALPRPVTARKLAEYFGMTEEELMAGFDQDNKAGENSVFMDRFKALCSTINSSPSKVAVECGIQASAVSRWRNNIAVPNHKYLVAIAKYFGVSVDVLLGLEPIPATIAFPGSEKGDGDMTAEVPELYKKIRELCREKKITLAKLCHDLHLPSALPADLKKGRKRGLTATQAIQIAHYFDMTVEELYGEPLERRNPIDAEPNPTKEKPGNQFLITYTAITAEGSTIWKNESYIHFANFFSIAEIQSLERKLRERNGYFSIAVMNIVPCFDSTNVSN